MIFITGKIARPTACFQSMSCFNGAGDLHHRKAREIAVQLLVGAEPASTEPVIFITGKADAEGRRHGVGAASTEPVIFITGKSIRVHPEVARQRASTEPVIFITGK